MISRTFRARAALLYALLLATAAPAAVRAQAGPNLAPQGASGATTASLSLADRIDAILARPANRRADWGIEVRELATGRLLYSRNAGRLFIPASNLKLLVTSTAAHHLAPDYRYRTTVYATGPVRDGVLQGDVVLYGRGDPLISDRGGRRRTGAWEELADSLLAAGVHRVAGGVVADDSYFEPAHLRPDWKPSDLRWWYAAPVGALGYNDNAVQTRSGEFAAVPNGAEYAGGSFRDVLESRGIALDRHDVRVVTDPARTDTAASLGSHWSDPLPEVIAPILLNSQNWIAETLLKTVGREVRGVGSWDAGIAVERDFLTRVVGIDSADFRLRDGSGLSANNGVTPRAFVQLLGYVARTPEMSVVRASLPVSGREGSLKTRLTDLPGRVWAKTGYIGGVDSLSGYVTTWDGRTVIFSIIANRSGQTSGRMKAGIDDVVRAIAASPAQ
ncbi:MAG TPA: D-alanyl-D-alanine carboxypeptidase/D-alanyl-D-alanine-endopeptidase [Longimicrobium sp.]